MELKIQQNVTMTDVKKNQKILLYSYLKRALILPIFFLSVGIIMKIYGSQKGLDIESWSYDYNKIIKKNIVTKKTYNYHITYGIGVGFICVGLYWVLITFRSAKGASNRTVKKIIAPYSLNVTINESEVFYSDYQSNLNNKWSAFSNFVISSETLFLMKGNDLFSALKIPLTSLTEDDLTTLKQLLNTKLHK